MVQWTFVPHTGLLHSNINFSSYQTTTLIKLWWAICFKIWLCLLFIQDGQFTFKKMQPSIQGSSPTFDIGDLPFETVAVIWDRVLFVREKWLLVSRPGYLFEIYVFCSRYELLFEMAYLLFEISDFLFKSRLFVKDGNFLSGLAISIRDQRLFIRDWFAWPRHGTLQTSRGRGWYYRGCFLQVHPLGNEHESHTYVRGVGDPYLLGGVSSFWAQHSTAT